MKLNNNEIYVMGIDPGSIITGYGLVKIIGNNITHVASGNIRINKTQHKFPQNLRRIFTGISEVIAKYHPNEIAIEKVFVHANVNSALKLGQARGAALAAIAENAIVLAEYTPRQIKQTVVGYGNATKNQIQHMVKFLLKLNAEPEENTADALAIALCHAQMRKILAKIQQAKLGK